VTQGELARYLFERGIELYRSGALTLEPVPVQQIATLYPKDLG
jgi:exonuclease VII small subunit